MKCDRCKKNMKPVETMGNTYLDPDRIILECSCGVVVNTRYDSRDFVFSEKQLKQLWAGE